MAMLLRRFALLALALLSSGAGASSLRALEREDRAFDGQLTRDERSFASATALSGSSGARGGDSEGCACLSCDGGAMSSPMPRVCLPSSAGCSVDVQSGCMGVSDSGKQGKCNCGTGAFSPARFNLGGHVRGLQPGETVLLGSSTHRDGAIGGSATMTLPVTKNGYFRFPDKLVSGQDFNVAVVTNPKGHACSVYYGKGRVRGEHVKSVQVNCAATWSKANEPWSERGKACDCLKCNGGGYAPYDAYCSGRSIGCAVGHGENGGCYGKSKKGETGRCTCGNGAFSEPEFFQLRATVFGIDGGKTLTLGSDTWTLDKGVSHENEQTPGGHKTVQTVVLRQNGDFVFPFKMAEGQQYQVRVIVDPLGQRCTVAAGRGVVVAGSAEQVTVRCFDVQGLRQEGVMGHGAAPAAEQKLYAREERLRDEEYGSATKVFAHSNDDGGSNFFAIMAIGFVPGLAYYIHELMSSHSSNAAHREYSPVGDGAEMASLSGKVGEVHVDRSGGGDIEL